MALYNVYLVVLFLTFAHVSSLHRQLYILPYDAMQRVVLLLQVICLLAVFAAEFSSAENLPKKFG